MSENRQVCFAVKGYKKRLTSLFWFLSIAYVLVVYVLKSSGFHINTPPRWKVYMLCISISYKICSVIWTNIFHGLTAWNRMDKQTWGGQTNRDFWGNKTIFGLLFVIIYDFWVYLSEDFLVWKYIFVRKVECLHADKTCLKNETR